MTADPVVTRARALWCELAGVPVEFGRTGTSVAVSPGSGLCPPSWAGIVLLDGAAIATAPTAEAAARLRGAAAGRAPEELVDAAVLRSLLPVARTLGPAALAYLSAADFRPAPVPVAEVPRGHPRVADLSAGVGREDADESALDEITSPAFAVFEDGEVTAAAGYRLWPRRVAHLSVLTATRHRGRGLARAAASAAVAHALGAGLLPQWRARPEPSRRVARALGFRERGAQLSLRLTD
ncbi:hypothetical protein GCM10010420_32900 [Streptomyces glaucosporus]|uniref:N-acetyltransferase domain-containing protein n=1 Tax=Streptomyces glaucosporus TaxID=284044 RepID=A0ABN3IGV0_9ACTN